MASHLWQRTKILPESKNGQTVEFGTSKASRRGPLESRAPPALLGKPLKTDDFQSCDKCEDDDDPLDAFGLPYIRPSHRVSEAQRKPQPRFAQILESFGTF